MFISLYQSKSVTHSVDSFERQGLKMCDFIDYAVTQLSSYSYIKTIFNKKVKYLEVTTCYVSKGERMKNV